MELTWDLLLQRVTACNGCALCNGRTHTVFGEGNREADLLFVGEGPGYEEDKQGRPFVGPAGQLLDKMLAAISLRREDVYIANIVKCRPPQNRVPLPEEEAACLPYLRGQVALLQPKIIVCLGATAAKQIYDPEIRITKQRGIWKESKGVQLVATYHPAALLRDQSKKHEAWADMQSIRDKYAAVQAAGGVI